jgi:hypothetical protein
VSWLVTGAWLGWPPPFAVEPRLTLSGQELPLVLLCTSVGLVYAVSLLGYARLTRRERERESQLQASQRGRITQSTAGPVAGRWPRLVEIILDGLRAPGCGKLP